MTQSFARWGATIISGNTGEFEEKKMKKDGVVGRERKHDKHSSFVEGVSFGGLDALSTALEPLWNALFVKFVSSLL